MIAISRPKSGQPGIQNATCVSPVREMSTSDGGENGGSVTPVQTILDGSVSPGVPTDSVSGRNLPLSGRSGPTFRQFAGPRGWGTAILKSSRQGCPGSLGIQMRCCCSTLCATSLPRFASFSFRRLNARKARWASSFSFRRFPASQFAQGLFLRHLRQLAEVSLCLFDVAPVALEAFATFEPAHGSFGPQNDWRLAWHFLAW
jgi:hypothetical protein